MVQARRIQQLRDIEREEERLRKRRQKFLREQVPGLEQEPEPEDERRPGQPFQPFGPTPPREEQPEEEPRSVPIRPWTPLAQGQRPRRLEGQSAFLTESSDFVQQQRQFTAAQERQRQEEAARLEREATEPGPDLAQQAAERRRIELPLLAQAERRGRGRACP